MAAGKNGGNTHLMTSNATFVTSQLIAFEQKNKLHRSELWPRQDGTDRIIYLDMYSLSCNFYSRTRNNPVLTLLIA